MEQNGSNQNMPSTVLCVRGCGYYGSQNYDGMCSKCFKDMVKRRQHNPSPNAALLSSAPASKLQDSLLIPVPIDTNVQLGLVCATNELLGSSCFRFSTV